MLNSFFMAFAMYSKIPVPKVEWETGNMRYVLCFFPFVGALLGAAFWAAHAVLEKGGAGVGLKGAILAAVPVAFTGGIHADGLIDVVDAYSSFGGREKRLEIMKDPHVGAFGIIYTAVYFILWQGLAGELSAEGLIFVCAGFILSRALSGICALTLPPAKNSGMLFEMAENSEGKCITFLFAFYLAVLAVLAIRSIYFAAAVFAASAFSFIFFRRFALKNFGGTTGDLAGFFLQVCEISMLAATVAVQKAVI